MNTIVYTSKQKHYQFSFKNHSATKNSPHSNVYCMEFFLNFLFEYSFIGIVKLKYTRRNEMWCRILEIEDLSKKVRKTQDRTSLTKNDIVSISFFLIMTANVIMGLFRMGRLISFSLRYVVKKIIKTSLNFRIIRKFSHFCDCHDDTFTFAKQRIYRNK